MRRVDAIFPKLKFNGRCVGLPVEVRRFRDARVGHGLHDVARVDVDDRERADRRPLITTESRPDQDDLRDVT